MQKIIAKLKSGEKLTRDEKIKIVARLEEKQAVNSAVNSAEKTTKKATTKKTAKK